MEQSQIERRIDLQRKFGLGAGLVGITMMLLALFPVWANADPFGPIDVDFAPTSTAQGGGQPIFFELTGCIDNPEQELDIFIEIETDLNDSQFGAFPDAQFFPHASDDIYTYISPPEIDRLEGDTGAGPVYDVFVACFVGDPEDPGSVAFDVGDFTYIREIASTTSTTSVSTTTTAPAGTTTTAPVVTTTTAPVGTTTTTAPVVTTTTAPVVTTTTAPVVTTTTAPAGTTTTTAAGGTTTTTTAAPGGTTTTTAAGATTTTTAAGGTTTTTAAGGTTTSTTVGATTTTAAPTLTVSDDTPTIGQRITVTGTGFGPGSSAIVELLSTPVRLGTFTVDAEGKFTGEVQIPLNTAIGAHEVRATGVAANGSPLVLSAVITVSKELPRTGADSWNTFRVSLLLIGLGMLAVGRGQLLGAKA